MNKNIIKRYILLGIPFIIGSSLYLLNIYNLVSSLLFFCGGYILIKNLCDYRKINKNIKIVYDKENRVLEDKINNKKENDYNKYRSYDRIPGLKRTRRDIKVRRRIK